MTKLQNLGLVFGAGSRQFQTTFNDPGACAEDSPLRAAYSHVMPTILGLLAAGLRVTRDPRVTHALTTALRERNDGRTLFEHFTSILSMYLGAVFGDTATLEQLKRVFDAAHSRSFSAEELPDWFVSFTGKREGFTLKDPVLRRSVFIALAAGIARAHQRCGLVRADAEHRYVEDLMRTVGGVTGGADITPTSIESLEITAMQYGAQQMGAPDLHAAGVTQTLLPGVLSSDLGDGRMVGAFRDLIVGLMDRDDQQSFGFYPADKARETSHVWHMQYAAATYRYRQRVAGALPAPLVDGDLTDSSFFTVSLRGR